MVKHMCFGCWDGGFGRPSVSSGLNCTILLYTSIIVLTVTLVTF